MMKKQGALEIERMIAFVLAITVAVVIYISIFGPDGGTAEAVGTINEKSDSFMNMIEEKARTSRNELQADEALLSTWNSLTAELEYVKQNQIEEYCIIPFQRSFFSERNNIELLQDDDDLLLKIGYSSSESQSGANLFETYPIDDMDFYVGEILCPTADPETGYCNDPTYDQISFGNIELRKIDQLKTDTVGLFLENVLTTDLSREDSTSYTYQPLFLYDGYDYEAQISTDPSIESAMYLADGTSGFIIAKNDTLVFMIVDLFGSSSWYANLMSDFTSSSGVDDGNPNGYAFCNPANNDLLIPRSEDFEDCGCSVAKNKAMCESLVVENCGVDCVWENDACIADPDNIKEFYRAMGDLASDIAADSETYDSCVAYYPFELTRDIPALQATDGSLNEENLEKYLDNMRWAFLRNRVSVYDNTEYSTLISMPYGHELSQRPDVSPQPTVFSFNRNGEEIHVNDVVVEKKNGAYGFFVEHGEDSISFLSTGDLDTRYDSNREDVIFCDPRTPYTLGKISTCTDAKGPSTCFYHGIHSDEDCFWNRGNRLCRPSEADDAKIDITALPEEVDERTRTLIEKIDSPECISEEDIGPFEVDDERYRYIIFDSATESYLVLRYVEIQRLPVVRVETRRVYHDYPLVARDTIERCPGWWEGSEEDEG